MGPPERGTLACRPGAACSTASAPTACFLLPPLRRPPPPWAPQLTDLWANDNQIESLDEVEGALRSQAGSLSCVYLRGNPCAAGHDYKLRMKFALPRLEQLDDNPV